MVAATTSAQPTRTHTVGEHGSRPAAAHGPESGLAQALGWFSIGLGLAELCAPRGLARTIGVDDHPVLLPLLGLREIASGVGIHSERQPAAWLWSRVAGDAMDLALLGAAFRKNGPGQERVAAATAAVAGVMLLDVLCAIQHSASGNNAAR